MKLSTARTAVYAGMAAAVFFGILALLAQSTVWYILMTLAFIAELVLFFGFIKCPHCGKHLDRVGMNSDITHCPFCGEALEETADQS